MRLGISQRIAFLTGIIIFLIQVSLYFFFQNDFSQTAFEDSRAHFIPFIIISVLLSCLAACVVGLIVFKYINKDLLEMSSMADRIANGNYSQKVIAHQGDEFGGLKKSMNGMMDVINGRINEILTNKTRFEAVLLSMFEGVMVMDGNGSILLMNEPLRRLLSIDIDPVGKNPLEVIRNIDIQEMIDKVIKNKSVFETREITLLFPLRKTFQVNAAAIAREKNIEGAILVFHDITELRRLEEVRRDFVANVSHEIRTPVTNIKGYAETLLDGALDDKENARDFLKIISADSDRLTQLVDDLLDLSRIESGSLKLNKIIMDIHPIIARVLLGTKRQADEKKITVINEMTSHKYQFYGDEKSITQVMLNLVDNAIKYNNPGGSIRFSAEDDGEVLTIHVADTGIGIPAEETSRIFERFYRVDKARSRELGGTGLGLSIAKHIIQAHGGKISVTSDIEKGSTFHVTLPKNHS